MVVSRSPRFAPSPDVGPQEDTGRRASCDRSSTPSPATQSCTAGSVVLSRPEIQVEREPGVTLHGAAIEGEAVLVSLCLLESHGIGLANPLERVAALLRNVLDVAKALLAVSEPARR